jgi:seryl-tRNA synthetase
MLDIRFIRDNAEAVQENTRRKGYDVNIDELLRLDSSRRELQQATDNLRQMRNDIAARMKGEKPSSELIAEGKQIKDELLTKEAELRKAETVFSELLKKVPNMALDDVPVGASEDENVIAKEVGVPTRFNFTPKNHAELAEVRGWLDKERAAKVAGSRFAYVKGDLALLWFALLNFAFSVLTNEDILKKIIADNNLNVSSKPFTPVLPPAVARTETYDATARLNKEEQTYKLADDDLWLNASAEHTMAPMYLGEILAEEQLPIRYVGYTTAFRREAGTYGKDMEGIFRLHQFNKLEMESFTTAETSLDEHLFMVAIQEYLMQQLQLPYRVVLKCTADIGGPNARGIDIDTWLPGQSRYRETHTADLITDYQTRRMNTRIRRKHGLEFAHTNDATVFSERPMIAILENYQREDGSVGIPEVLRPYMGGREAI